MMTSIYERDYWPTEEWKTASLEDVGMDPQKIENMKYMINSHYKNMTGLLVIRKGYIAYEKYFNGFSMHDTQHVASLTKSVISALIGIALDKGYIDSVDQKIVEFFPEAITPSSSMSLRCITIKHLLMMTAPFPWKHEPFDRLARQKNWVHYILKQLDNKLPLGKFQYSTAGTHLLSAILTATTGMSACAFANYHLFRHIGMKEIEDAYMKSFGMKDLFGDQLNGWVNDPQGITTGGWGLTTTVRDLARFGFLYLNHGKWDNKQIISDTWIRDSVAMNENKYGYLWWLIQLEDQVAYTAAGSGGNHIFCIPHQDLVVVMTSKTIQNPQERWPLLEQYILPAIID
ncbi:serine hydrolase domain-containing protein [Longirhabdus pacifica]|uniref:serine hydrolase domain-containing protein n=1 Tax=Longirhabdus pacifica TaxID=2305227 RepID=UPI001F0C6E20|nr:serine hydrolase [Longirhabdus pacifica]